MSRTQLFFQLSLALLIGLLPPSWAQADDHTKTAYGTWLDLSAEPGSVRHLGTADLFAPLHQRADRLSFVNLRGRLDSEDSSEFNLGLGHRRLLTGGKAIVGAYTYLDSIHTTNDNRFYQITLGGEYLSGPFDARFNGYVPLDGQASISARNATVIAASDRVQIRYDGGEIPLYGFDAEAGLGLSRWLLPGGQDHDSSYDLRFYAGLYHFFRSGRDKVTGPRARLELRLNGLDRWAGFLPVGSRLILGAEAQHDKPRGTQYFGLVRLRIPLGGSGRKGLRRGMDLRMTDPVVRDVDIVTATVQRVEPALFADTGAAVAGVQSAASAVELFRHTSLGRPDTIVMVDSDITTSLPNQLQQGQWLVSGRAAVPLRTASGVRLQYRPGSGAARLITQELPGESPVRGSVNGNIAGVDLIQTGFDGQPVRNPPLIAVSELAPGGAGLAQVSGISPDGARLRFSIECDTENGPVPCENLQIDPASGLISVIPGREREPVEIFNATVTDAAERSATQFFFLLTEEVRQEAAAITQTGGALPNHETVQGINLRYGNDYQCGGDSDTFGGACDRSGESKIAYVRRTIDALLRHDRAQGSRIISALQRNMPTLALFNSEIDLEDSEAFLGLNPATQDLQATEVFVGAENRGGVSGDGVRRSATLEEVVHLIHNFGISEAYPELQLELDRLTAEALADNVLNHNYDDGSGIDTGGDLPRTDLDDEYFAIAVEAYFNLRGFESSIRSSSVCTIGRGANPCPADRTPRDDLRANHRGIYDLIERLFGPRDSLY